MITAYELQRIETNWCIIVIVCSLAFLGVGWMIGYLKGRLIGYLEGVEANGGIK